MLNNFFNSTEINNSLLIGYYGGGNFGDELLLEVLSHKLTEKGNNNVIIRYAGVDNFSKYHGDFGLRTVEAANKKSMMNSILKSKNIIIGGGGLWGLDTNLNVLLMSVLLFVLRYVFFKKVYMIGVGYYNSTGRLGHLGAFFAAKASNKIIARDEETRINFQRFKKSVEIDKDIAFMINDEMIVKYDKESLNIEKNLLIKKPTYLISLRKFSDNSDNYNHRVKKFILEHDEFNYMVCLLQPEKEFPAGKAIIDELKELSNVKELKTDCNPMLIVSFLKRNSQSIRIISPQFHIIAVAIILKIDFLPIYYDNKVVELLRNNNFKESINIKNINQHELEYFFDSNR